MNRIVHSVVSYQSVFNKKILYSNSLICLSGKKRFMGSFSTEKNDTKPYQSVSDYYAGKSVLITGGTGFLGKVLIERLLYNCSDIENIYILIRGKKDLTIEGRLHRMFSLPLFDKLKSSKPDALNKVIPIGGDLIIPELFNESKDEQILIENVSVVFHSAATVSFTERFSNVMSINFEGTKKLFDFSKKIKNLKTFLYVSTAYSNGDKLMIDEMIYPPKRRVDEVNSFINKYGDNEKETRKFLRGMPNTYTLSKSLCENYIDDNLKPIKAIILRPSIVTPVLKEPIPGWIDTDVVPTYFFSDIAKGLTRFVYSDRNYICDMIPVDYVCNLAIVAAARGNKSDKALVYNSCTSSTNPITLKEAGDLFLEASRKHGQNELKPTPVLLIPSIFLVKMLTLTLETVPPLLGDIWLRLTGRKPKYMAMHKRARYLKYVIEAFSFKSFYFKSDKSQSLIASLDEQEKIRFQFDPRTIVWREYMTIFYRGVKTYLKNF